MSSDTNKASLKYVAAKKHHYNMHSRTLPIEQCSIRECKAAVKVWYKANA